MVSYAAAQRLAGRLSISLTTPVAVLIGAAIIALSIVGAEFVAPYRVAAVTGGGIYRLNAITGHVRHCYGTDDNCETLDEVAGSHR